MVRFLAALIVLAGCAESPPGAAPTLPCEGKCDGDDELLQVWPGPALGHCWLEQASEATPTASLRCETFAALGEAPMIATLAVHASTAKGGEAELWTVSPAPVEEDLQSLTLTLAQDDFPVAVDVTWRGRTDDQSIRVSRAHFIESASDLEDPIVLEAPFAAAPIAFESEVTRFRGTVGYGLELGDDWEVDAPAELELEASAEDDVVWIFSGDVPTGKLRGRGALRHVDEAGEHYREVWVEVEPLRRYRVTLDGLAEVADSP